MSKAKIVYFYPENPAVQNQGNNARALFLLKYFKEKGVSVDFVGEESENFTTIEVLNLKKEKLIHNGWLLKKNTKGIKHFVFKILPKKISRGLLSIYSKKKHKTSINFDRTKTGQIEDFEKIIYSGNYECIIISYAYWSKLISTESKARLKNTKTIIDTHDFMTSQFQNNKYFDIENYFNSEIKSLKKFDEIWAISIEEHFIFSQFLKEKNTLLIPHGNISNVEKKLANPSIDIIYVASDNEHNIKAINWFLKKVYPSLPSKLKLTFVGKICNKIAEYPNITKLTFVEDLDQIYADAKISICPMLSGTGLKIKVVEALSFGLPIVCNQRGVDGLLNKTNNGCLATNSSKTFAKLIIKLLNDKTFYEKHKNNSIVFFKNSLSKETVYEKLDNSFFPNKKQSNS